MSRVLTEQGRQRREDLLRQAERLFAERGYDATRIADICEAAGVAKGLFYWYFESKQALFADVVRSVRQQLRRAQARAMHDGSDAVAHIRHGAEASVRFLAERTSFFAAVADVGRNAALAAVLAEGVEIYTADVERLIDKAKADGRVAQDADTRLLALGVVGAVSWFANAHRTGRTDADVDTLAAFVGTWVANAIAPD